MAEKKPIIEVYLSNYKEAWHELSEEKRKEVSEKMAKKSEELGMKMIISCDCRWSNQEWEESGVVEYPDLEALQKWIKFLYEELQADTYYEWKFYLGTRKE